MKKLIFLSALIIGSLSIQVAHAQIGIHLNFNLGARPVYVPAPEPVAAPDEYYYLPDAEAYYSVPEHVYYYQNQGRWVSGAYMPGRFHDFDYNHMRHYVVNEPRPYLRNDYYRNQYRNIQFYGQNDRNFHNQNYNVNRGRGDDRAYNFHDDHHERDQRYNANYQRNGRDDRNYRN